MSKGIGERLLPSFSAVGLQLVKSCARWVRRGRVWGTVDARPHNEAEAFVGKGDHVLYVGMWRSETMERWSRAIGRREGIGVSADVGKLWVVEADPTNCQILAYEAQRRELRNVQIINAALWSVERDVKLSRQRVTDRNFILESDIIGNSDLYAADNVMSVEVLKSYPLDRLVEMHRIPIDSLRHMHLTIGGSEVEALRGAERLLEKGRLTIFIKSITSHRQSGRRIVSDVTDFLESRDIPYSVRRRAKDGLPKEIVIDTRRIRLHSNSAAVQ